MPQPTLDQRPSRSVAFPSRRGPIHPIQGVFVQVREVLKPDGLFLGALFGGDTLFELR